LSSVVTPVESAPSSTLRVFMTGASGCIGHYILELLLQVERYEIFLLLRNPSKLKLPVEDNPRVHILRGSLGDIGQFAELLATLDIAILAAAAWGGDQVVININVDCNLKLMALLNSERCQQVIYFSTASVLDQNNQPLPEAGKIGTDYIRSKYECHRQLPELAIYDKITTVFPTLVFGGDKDKPASFISAGLKDVTKWMGLVRFFKADGGFHFAHAQDIAQVVNYLVEHPSEAGYREYVIGNPALTVDQVVKQVCDYLGLRVWFQIPLSFLLADFFIKVFRVEMAPWDYFCLQNPHFVYANAVNPSSFGIEPYCVTMADLLEVHGIEGKA
jgi:nucleoside-diphosphate-sugar epimerase